MNSSDLSGTLSHWVEKLARFLGFADTPPPVKPRVFISYAPPDYDRVHRLYSLLLREGFDPWMDRQDITLGTEWQPAISEALSRSDFVLVCLSSRSSESGFLQREIRFALQLSQERPRRNTFLIPLRLEECEVPAPLRRFQWLNLYEPHANERLLGRLRGALESQSIASGDVKTRYDIDNISALLLENLDIEELRKLAYDLPDSRYLYQRAAGLTSKFEMVAVLLKATTPDQIEFLLDWVERYRPEAYGRHHPYRLDGTRQKMIHGDGYGLSKPLDNPYVVGNPIQPENTRVFLGRFDIAKAILAEIRRASQRPSILLYGRRRMGKTSAILNMGTLIQDTTLITVYVSGQSARFHTNRHFCYHLVQEIARRLSEESVDIAALREAGFLDEAAFASSPLLTLARFFEQCEDLLLGRSLHCLVAIDEYEEIDSHIGISTGEDSNSITRDLLLELRDTMQHRPHFVFLFAGTHFLRDLSAVDWTSIFINVKTLHVSFLDRRDSRALLTRPVPEMVYSDDSLIEKILGLTGCQPFLLQATASELVNCLNTSATRVVTARILQLAIDQVLVKQNTYFDHIWDIECNGPERKEVLARVIRRNSGARESEFLGNEAALRDLVRREVLRSDQGTVRLTMPLLRQWMRKNQHIL